jgi:hypothetical protein
VRASKQQRTLQNNTTKPVKEHYSAFEGTLQRLCVS